MIRFSRRLLAPAAIVAGLAGSMASATAPAHAAGDAVAPKQVAWTFNGVFGRYNYPQLRRGLQVYRKSARPVTGCASSPIAIWRRSA